jgi:hypothetical protein
MRSEKREARPGMFGILALGGPGPFVVALHTVGAQFSLVRVRMAAVAAALGKNRYRSAVVVAPQTLGRLVGPMEWNTSLGCVVEREVTPQGVPVVADVAKGTVGGKRVMGDRRTVLGVPRLWSLVP